MEKNNTKKSFKQVLVDLTKMQCFTAVVVIILMVAFLTIASPVFMTWANIKNLFVAAAVMGVLGCGTTVGMLMGALDISQYSATAFIGMCAATFLNRGASSVTAILFCIICGLAIGALNGFVVTRLRIVPLIATVGTQYILRGFAYIVGNGAYVTFSNDFLSGIGKGDVLGIPTVVIIMLITMLIYGFILRKTTFGRKLYAVGGSQKAAFLAGIKPKNIMFKAFMLNGLTDGLAAILVISMFSSCNPQYGTGADFDVIVSVVLGGVSLSGGKGKLVGTLLGILIMCMISNMFSLLGVSSYMQTIVRGFVLIAAVALDAARGRGYLDN